MTDGHQARIRHLEEEVALLKARLEVTYERALMTYFENARPEPTPPEADEGFEQMLRRVLKEHQGDAQVKGNPPALGHEDAEEGS